MDKSDYPRVLKDIQKKGYVMPGLDGGGKATIPMMPAVVECPHCGERVPISVQVRNLTFAVTYPVRKENLGGNR